MNVDGAANRLVVEVRERPDLRVRLAGELDLANVGELGAALAPVLAEPPDLLVFDLGALDFMDSSGIAAMLRAAAIVSDVRVENPSAIIRQVLLATGLAGILKVEP